MRLNDQLVRGLADGEEHQWSTQLALDLLDSRTRVKALEAELEAAKQTVVYLVERGEER